jgi:hypothetical protein
MDLQYILIAQRNFIFSVMEFIKMALPGNLVQDKVVDVSVLQFPAVGSSFFL